MKTTTSTLDAPEGVALFVYRWRPEKPAKAVVRLAHWLNSVVARVAPPSLSAASAR